jgi:hypothetical protein
MSKQSDAKLEQRYTKQAMQCNKCVWFVCTETREELPGYGIRIVEKNKHCEIGGFAVQSSASCDRFDWKVEP